MLRNSRLFGKTVLLVAGLAFTGFVLVGCGSESSSAITPSQLAQARSAVIRVATPIVNNVPDRYLRGPKRLRVKCRPSRTPEQIYCSATGYARAQAVWNVPRAPFIIVIESEDWVVPIRGGRLGKPRPGPNPYSISHYLEADNNNGCSAGKSINC